MRKAGFRYLFIYCIVPNVHSIHADIILYTFISIIIIYFFSSYMVFTIWLSSYIFIAII